MGRRSIIFALVAIAALAGCNIVNKVVKDIPVEEMDALKSEYMGKTAWTRALLIDLGPEGIIDRDVKAPTDAGSGMDSISSDPSQKWRWRIN
jgi:predicted small secreted protein